MSPLGGPGERFDLRNRRKSPSPKSILKMMNQVGYYNGENSLETIEDNYPSINTPNPLNPRSVHLKVADLFKYKLK